MLKLGCTWYDKCKLFSFFRWPMFNGGLKWLSEGLKGLSALNFQLLEQRTKFFLLSHLILTNALQLWVWSDFCKIWWEKLAFIATLHCIAYVYTGGFFWLDTTIIRKIECHSCPISMEMGKKWEFVDSKSHFFKCTNFQLLSI